MPSFPEASPMTQFLQQFLSEQSYMFQPSWGSSLNGIQWSVFLPFCPTALKPSMLAIVPSASVLFLFRLDVADGDIGWMTSPCQSVGPCVMERKERSSKWRQYYLQLPCVAVVLPLVFPMFLPSCSTTAFNCSKSWGYFGFILFHFPSNHLYI